MTKVLPLSGLVVDCSGTFSAQAKKIALVVLDLTMPRMEGKQRLQIQLKINPQIESDCFKRTLDAQESQQPAALATGFVNKQYGA